MKFLKYSGMRTSVIIPYYNGTEFIYETLDSLRGQSVQADEILIVNDGSTNSASLELLDLIPEKYPSLNISVHHKEHSGISGTLTYGATKAVGDIIFVVDSDDLLHGRYIQKYLARFSDEPTTDVVCSYYGMFYSKIGFKDESSFHKVYKPVGLKQPEVFYYNCAGGANVAIRAQTVGAVGYWDERFKNIQDWGLMLTCLHHGLNVYIVEEAIYYYRIHSASESNRLGVSEHKNRIIYEFIKQKFTELEGVSYQEYKSCQRQYTATAQTSTRTTSKSLLRKLKQKFYRYAFAIRKLFR